MRFPSVSRSRLSLAALLPLTLAALAALAAAPHALGQTSDADEPEVVPQIVRLSYVEGDVRLERGKKSGPNPTGWVTAKTGVPLETGFSLVTGQGRAEIEFEDSSTAYVDANSAVTFNQLTTSQEAPQTALTLLTGTLTLHLVPTIRGERYLLLTPKHDIFVPYPDRSYLRVQSFVDGMDVTPLSAVPVRVSSSGGTSIATAGHTLHYTGGTLPIVTPSEPEGSGFDTWVTGRLADRRSQMDEMMMQARLNGPLPGLTALDHQGQFFACAPYGTCWAPTGGWMANNGRRLTGLHWEDDEEPFPCWVGRYRELVGTDPLTRRRQVLFSEEDQPWGYQWAVCHAGSWIQRDHHWVWVVGKRLHHHCPVHWVQSGGHKGYVPIHPKDRPGLPPENLKHGIFTAADKREGAVERVAWNAGDPVKVLKDTPRSFRQEYHGTLPAAEPPKLEAHLEPLHLHNHEASVAAHADLQMSRSTTLAASRAGTLTFNAHSQTFMLAHDVDHGGHVASVAQPFGGRADPNAGRGGGMVSPSGFSGASGSSSFSHGGSSSFSGSISHGGASSSSFSGGGGSHTSASAPSASAGGSASAGASSGGGHH